MGTTWEHLRRTPAKRRDQGRPRSKTSQQDRQSGPVCKTSPRFKSGRRLQLPLRKPDVQDPLKRWQWESVIAFAITVCKVESSGRIAGVRVAHDVVPGEDLLFPMGWPKFADDPIGSLSISAGLVLVVSLTYFVIALILRRSLPSPVVERGTSLRRRGSVGSQWPAPARTAFDGASFLPCS